MEHLSASSKVSNQVPQMQCEAHLLRPTELRKLRSGKCHPVTLRFPKSVTNQMISEMMKYDVINDVI